MSIQYKVNTRPALKSLKEFKQKLSKREINRGLSVAANKCLEDGMEEAKKAISSLYNLHKSQLGGIKIKKSNETTLRGHLTAPSNPLPLSVFLPQFHRRERFTGVKKKGRSKKRITENPGVSVEVYKGSRLTVKGAFMLNGLSHVFIRGYYRRGNPFGLETASKGKNKLYFTRMLTVSIYGAMQNKKNRPRIKEKLTKNMIKYVRQEFKRRIKKTR